MTTFCNFALRIQTGGATRLFKVMKRAASCKHRQTVNIVQCDANMENLFVSMLCKNESEINFFTVTSSWGYQSCFSAETFLVTQPAFMMVLQTT